MSETNLLSRINAMVGIILGQGNEGDFDDMVCCDLLLDCGKMLEELYMLPLENGL
jgi:hypothetical protein